MENKHLVKLTLSQLTDIYYNHLTKDFDESRVKPLKDIISLIEEGNYRIIGYQRHGILLGYAFIANSPIDNCALLDYFSIFEEYRRHGFAHKFIRALKSEFKDLTCVLSEVTEDEYNTLMSLYPGFYKKLGTVETDIKYTNRNQKFVLMYFPILKKYQKGRTKANFLSIMSKLNPTRYIKLKKKVTDK